MHVSAVIDQRPHGTLGIPHSGHDVMSHVPKTVLVTDTFRHMTHDTRNTIL